MKQFKNRYMVMRVFIDGKKDASGNDPIIISRFNLLKAIKDCIHLNFGECGLALSIGSLQVKYVNPVTNIFVVRALREDHLKVLSAMSMVRSIRNCPVTLCTLNLTGSIRACSNAALKCEEASFDNYKLKVGHRLTPELTEHMQRCYEKLKALNG